MRRPLLLAACALSLTLITAEVAGATPPRVDDASITAEVAAGTYVVLLGGTPTALAADVVRSDSPDAVARRNQLLADQDRILATIGDPETLYRYTEAVDGFAAELTTAQVKQLQSDPDVLAVAPNRLAHLDRTTPLPRHAALASGSVPASPLGAAEHSRIGRGVVIGVIDSGIWPENPSFAAAQLDNVARERLYPGFTGTCQPGGERWGVTSCNGKVVAAQSYVDGFGSDNIAAAEFLSPRDASGHGSHVAATAAGNQGVAVTIGKQSFGRVSGVAASAALAVYKACWAAPDPAHDGCTSVDTIRAIDQAVSDGVDVLNLSLSDGDPSAVDPVEIALLNAADAGVFVAASAGDDGPGAATVAHPGPWVTTVAASTGRSYPGVVALGNGATVQGSMVSRRPVGSRPLVYAGDAPAASVDAADAAQCLPGTLDAAIVEGAIVVCDRGVASRVAKGETVDQAGGRAMVLANTGPAPTETDIHAVSAVHVDAAGRSILRTYIAESRRPTASIRRAAASEQPTTIAGFSSRGPVSIDDPDLLKPDLSAVGVNVLAAVSPSADLGRLWDLSSGTSMAAAQVSGAAAMIRAEHHDWSPAAVKSALMTTAATLPAAPNPLAAGAGELRTQQASDPGLVYNSTARSWWRYLRGEGVTSADGSPVSDRALDPSNLNVASIAVGSLVGEQRITRRVTNVSDKSETYTADVSGLRGIATQVIPSSFRLNPGESRNFRVVFSARKSARYDSFTKGRLTWRGSEGHRVASPLVVRADTVRVVDEVTVSGSTGDTELRADAGVTGTLTTSVSGPVAADPVSLTLEPGTFDPAVAGSSASAAGQSVVVPAHALAARWEVTSDSDVDLYAYREGRLVATSSRRSGNEQITLDKPVAGDYEIYVVAPDVGIGDPVDASFTAWAIPDRASGGSFDVGPRRLDVTGGQRFGLQLSWNKLDPSRRYLAAISHDGSASQTFVTIN